MKKKIKITLVSLIALVAIFATAFFIYTSDYYHSDETAVSLLEAENVVQIDKDLILISGDSDSSRALVFYPGAKVEYTAYLPLLDASRAASIMAENPDIDSWYIGGHSM